MSRILLGIIHGLLTCVLSITFAFFAGIIVGILWGAFRDGLALGLRLVAP